MVLVAYDVNTESPEGRRRLAKVARICENWGQRVQNSVFECLVEPGQWETAKRDLLETMDSEKDSIRFYYLGSNWRRRVEHHGAKESADPESLIIV